MSKIRPVIHEQHAMSLQTFAASCGIKVSTLLYYIHKGRVIGARQHPLTKRWWIYPPAKLITGRM